MLGRQGGIKMVFKRYIDEQARKAEYPSRRTAGVSTPRYFRQKIIINHRSGNVTWTVPKKIVFHTLLKEHREYTIFRNLNLDGKSGECMASTYIHVLQGPY